MLIKRQFESDSKQNLDLSLIQGYYHRKLNDIASRPLKCSPPSKSLWSRSGVARRLDDTTDAGSLIICQPLKTLKFPCFVWQFF